MIGNRPPEIPLEIIETFQIKELSYRYQHWIGKGPNAFYKLAPYGSTGQRDLKLEGSIIQRLKHPNIVTGHLVEEYNWEILELSVIQGNPITKLRDQLSTDEKMKILKDVEDATKYINGEGILHTDISSENIIWDGSKCYLIDFEEAKLINSPINMNNSPDFIGGPPCCWGDIGYGYKTYLCIDSLREWLLYPEFLNLKDGTTRSGIWNPDSIGNTCEPETTPDDDSIYQNITFGNDIMTGQRNPELRFYYLCASKKVSFDNKRILDIGCNFGRLGALLEQFNIAQYVGMDIDTNYIDIAKGISKLEKRSKLTFITGDICNSETENILKDLSPDGFDLVICQSVYHHFVDKLVFWKIFSNLGCSWFIFEGPVDDSKYLLKDSWSEEKAFIKEKGYEITFVSKDNDYPDRHLFLFEKVKNDAC